MLNDDDYIYLTEILFLKEVVFSMYIYICIFLDLKSSGGDQIIIN